MFGAPLNGSGSTRQPSMWSSATRSGSPLLPADSRRPGTADSYMSGSQRGGGSGAGKRMRLQTLKTKMDMQQSLEKQWQLDNGAGRPITPQVLNRLSEQVSMLMDDEFPELAQLQDGELPTNTTAAGAEVLVVEPLSPLRDPAPSPVHRASNGTSAMHSSGRYDAGPFRPNGSSALRDQPLGGSTRHSPSRLSSSSLAPLDRRSSGSDRGSQGSRRSSRRSGGGRPGSRGGSVRSSASAVFSGCSNNTRGSLTPMTAQETLALDAGMRRKMEQAGATPSEVKRQLQFKRRQGRPISREGRCMYEDLGNTLRMLGVAVTKRELKSFTKRFRGSRDDEVEANMILDNLWSESVMRAASQISIQPSVWVGGIPDCAARGDLLR